MTLKTFIPDLVAMSILAAALGGIVFHLGEVNDARRVRPPRERRLNRQSRILLPMVPIALMWLVMWFAFSTPRPPFLRMLGLMSPGIAVTTLPLIMRWWFDRRIRRDVPYPLPDAARLAEETLDLNRRMPELAEITGGRAVEVMIGGLLPDTRFASILRASGKLRVSRLMLDVMSDAELDYVLARELVPLEDIPAIGRHSRLVPIIVTGFTLLMRWGSSELVTTAIAASIALVVSAIVAAWLNRQCEQMKDLLALKALGDLTVAQSAVTKLMKHGPLTIAVDDPTKDHRVRQRLAILRDRASQPASGIREI